MVREEEVVGIIGKGREKGEFFHSVPNLRGQKKNEDDADLFQRQREGEREYFGLVKDVREKGERR